MPRRRYYGNSGPSKPTDGPAWYKRTNKAGLIYYTPVKDSRYEWVAVGDGKKRPTMQEMADAANQANAHGSYDMYVEGLIHRDTNTDESGDPVDLPSGTYTYHRATGSMPEHLLPFDLRDDVYVHMPNVYDKIVHDIKDFMASEQLYRDMQIQYRRGLFIFGPPGNGKTCLIRDIIKNAVPANTVSFFLHDLPSDGFLETVKATLTDRMKFFVFEELVSILLSGRAETEMLDFLDGERSVDKSLIIATTNYPELMPGNIVDRPSRFDRLYRVPNPTPEMRRLMLNHFLGEVVESVITETEGMSIAALKEIAILVRVRNMTIMGAIKTLREHHNMVKQSFKTGENSIGIRSRRFDPDDFDE